MWLTLIIRYCLFRLSSANMVPWYPVTSTVGEQIDLVGVIGNFGRNWTRSVANGKTKGAADFPDSENLSNFTQTPYNSIDRDREPLDEVERIEPRQWQPVGLDTFYTEGSFVPSTTTISLPRSPLDPPTLAQRNPSTQR